MPFPARSLAYLLLLLFAAGARPGRADDILGDDINEDDAHEYNSLPKFRLALETGYSQWMYNPDSVSDDYDKYLNTLESGWNFSADAAWFPWPKGGIGAQWIWFLSRTGADGIQSRLHSTSLHDLRERASGVYYGPTFLTRLHFGRFGLLVAEVGGGFLSFSDTWTDNGDLYVVKAKTYGVLASVGWDYFLYRFAAVGVNARVLLSNIREYTFNGEKVTIQQPEDPHYWSNITLSRFELNAGLRFGL